jgi:hypothetical protein
MDSVHTCTCTIGNVIPLFITSIDQQAGACRGQACLPRKDNYSARKVDGTVHSSRRGATACWPPDRSPYHRCQVTGSIEQRGRTSECASWGWHWEPTVSRMIQDEWASVHLVASWIWPRHGSADTACPWAVKPADPPILAHALTCSVVHLIRASVCAILYSVLLSFFFGLEQL